MIFGQVKKTDNLPLRPRYAVGAGVLFVLLLAALVQVVSGQVKQAQSRQLRHQALQAALSGCAAQQLGAARSRCMAQLTANPELDFKPLAEVELRLGAEPAQPDLSAGQYPVKRLAGLAPQRLTETGWVP